MMIGHRKESARSGRRAFRGQVEALERREVLSSPGSVLAAGLPRVAPAAGGDVVTVSPSARRVGGPLLGDSSYTGPPLWAGLPTTGALVLTGADLHNPRLAAMARAVYHSGQTVAIAQATPSALRVFESLVG